MIHLELVRCLCKEKRLLAWHGTGLKFMNMIGRVMERIFIWVCYSHSFCYVSFETFTVREGRLMVPKNA